MDTSNTSADLKYPRVVIVSSNVIRKDSANGIFIGSLFKGWPRDKLAQIYFPISSADHSDYDACKDFIKINFLARAKKANPSSQTTTTQSLTCFIASKIRFFLGKVLTKIRQNRLATNYFRFIQEMWYGTALFSRSLEKQIALLNPDIVYAAIGNFSLAKTTSLACKKLDIPLYLHAGDDFVTTLYDDVPLSHLIQRQSDKWYRRLVEQSKGRAAISSVMANEYEERYGCLWSVFPTLIDSRKYNTESRKHDEKVRLTYAGNLGLGRWESLKNLAGILHKIQKKNRLNIELNVYSSKASTHKYKSDDKPELMHLKGWADPDELPNIFHNSDILIHVESFDLRIARYTRLSFSTKLSQYMAAGRCVLALGPKEIGSIKILRADGTGVVINDTDSCETEKLCMKTLVNSDFRQAYAEAGLRWAKKYVTQDIALDRFRQEVLCASNLSEKIN